MAQLAIKGHSTRGEEVIEILEMLGGKNNSGYNGESGIMCYYINKEGNIEGDKEEEIPFPVQIFTIKGFLEKFPYKVGDRVRVADYESEVRIYNMSWDGCEIQYQVFTDETEWYSAEELNKYNEISKKETMEKEISGSIINRFICLEGYDFYDDKGNIIDTKEIIVKKKQPKYPNTYVECAKLLDCFGAAHIDGYKGELLDKFQELLICRDAYWKITGDWQYDVNKTEECFYIVNKCGRIVKEHYMNFNHILAFPTEEMRDAFYENFKELIEECKELL